MISISDGVLEEESNGDWVLLDKIFLEAVSLVSNTFSFSRMMEFSSFNSETCLVKISIDLFSSANWADWLFASFVFDVKIAD